MTSTDRPYYVLTRKYNAKGDCKTGRRTFRTRAEQLRYINTAPYSIAITAYN